MCDTSDQLMDKELHYVTVAFKTKSISTHETPTDLEAIYDDVRTVEQAWDRNDLIAENQKKAPLCTLLHLVAAGLGIICVTLVSVVIALSIHFNTVLLEQHREKTDLTAQNQQLWKEKADLERQNEDLRRERDGLNWTFGVILEYDNFPVKTHCPEKACKPCLDGWVQFQSNCYFFSESDYSYAWNIWKGSRDECSRMRADLVVIDSQEEQEFINNHTKVYDDENHGYWIGLNKENAMGMWTWVDGSNFTVMYWRTEEASDRLSCALILPCARAPSLANWRKSSCYMKNRWICETRALIKESAPSSKLII